MSSLLEFATKLDPGTAFSPSQVPAGAAGIRQTLEQNGYYEPQIVTTTERHVESKQVDRRLRGGDRAAGAGGVT